MLFVKGGELLAKSLFWVLTFNS